MSEENEDPTRSFLTRDAYDKEDQWQDNKDKLEHPGYSYVRHTSDQYISGMRNASDGYAWGAMQLNISDLKGAMGEVSDYDDTALKRELEKQGKEIETNANAIEGKADEDHTHDNITDPYDDSWIQPEIDKKSDLTHTHDITHDHDSEYQQKGDYADKNHIHDLNHNHDGEYLTSDDLPDPYDDTQIRDDFAAADQQLQDQITIINDTGYDDTAINQRIGDEEQAREDGDAALSVKIDGKADDDHTHDPIDLEHNHNSQYQPIGDYATKTDLDSKSDITHSHTPQDITHDHNSEYQPLGNYADTDHDHPPQDLTHDHDMEYAPIHEHPYADTNHAHPPQDLTHDHDTEYQPVGDYATNQTVTDGDADLQEQIDAISSSGGYNDSWIQPAIDTGDANTLGGANAYTDAEIAKIVVPDVGDFATTDYVDAGDLAVEAKIPDVSGFATSEELTSELASKSDTSHEHDEFTHTHDFSHNHDGEYALEHDHPYAPQAHDHPHDHEGDYQPTGDYALEGHEHLHDHDGTYQPAGNYSQIGHEHLHDHDGTYQPSGDYASGSHTHPPQDLTHDHAEYFLSGIEYDGDGNAIPLPYPTANALGEAVDGKSETNHTHDLSHTHREYADKTEFELHQHEHNHDEEYVKKGHTHSNMQNEIDELKVHKHEGAYLPIGDWEGDQGFADDKAIFDFIEDMFKVQELTDRTQNVRIGAIEEREKNYADKSHNHEGVSEHEHDSVYLKKTGGVITGAIKTRGTLSNRHIGMQGTPPLKEDGSQDTTSSWGIKMDIDHANSYKSEFVVANRYGNIVKVTGGADPQAHIGPVKRDGNNKPVPLKLSADPSEGDHAIRKSWADKNYLGNSGSQKHEGSLVIQKSSGVMLELKKNDTTTLEFWSDGSVEQPNLGANSKDENLVTRKNLKDANKPLEERIAVLEENQTGLVGIYLGEFELVYTGDRPTGATESNGNVRVWHKTVASSTTNPKNECKIGMHGDVGLVSAIDAFSGEARVILQQQGALQTWKFGGAWGTDSNKVLHISADDVSGDDLKSGGALTKMWFLPV